MGHSLGVLRQVVTPLIHRTVSAKYTFVLLTDRKALDTQLHTTFVGWGVSINKDDRANRAFFWTLAHYGNPGASG